MIVVAIGGKYLHFGNGLFKSNISNYQYILQEDETSFFISKFGKGYLHESLCNIGNSARKY